MSYRSQLFIDSDGVMMDMDARILECFGATSKEIISAKGDEYFWKLCETFPGFYLDMKPMPGAHWLLGATHHLRPIILTGCPPNGWAELQKIRSFEKNFPGVPMITCQSRNKRVYCRPGDVLIDDWDKYRDLWVEAGGTFILYTSAEQAYEELRTTSVWIEKVTVHVEEESPS